MEDTEKYTATEFIQKFIVNDLSGIVNSHPYHAFFLLSAAIELFGKCMNPTPDWQATNSSDFKTALTLRSLQKYSGINGLPDKMYSSLRCGLLHACMPKSDIKLVSDKNDLDNSIIGCNELYDDIKIAWNELKQSPLCKKDMSSPIFEVNKSLSSSGMTATNRTIKP